MIELPLTQNLHLFHLLNQQPPPISLPKKPIRTAPVTPTVKVPQKNQINNNSKNIIQITFLNHQLTLAIIESLILKIQLILTATNTFKASPTPTPTIP
jgi:hypothetical protein